MRKVSSKRTSAKNRIDTSLFIKRLSRVKLDAAPFKAQIEELRRCQEDELNRVFGAIELGSELLPGWRPDADSKEAISVTKNVSELAGVTPKLLENAAYTLERDPERLLEKFDTGKSIHSISRRLRKEDWIGSFHRDRALAASMLDLSAGPVIEGSFLDPDIQALIPDESVDLIFSDPPYDGDSIDLYGSLSLLGWRKLVPGGLLIAYSGGCFVPEVASGLASHLKFVWKAEIVHGGEGQRVFARQMVNASKPLWIFAKPPVTKFWELTCDLVLGGGKEKKLHPWQQGLKEAREIVGTFCPKGGFVLDPMTGSGTSLIAAHQTGRRYLGIEVDPGHVETSRHRLAEAMGTDEPEETREAYLRSHLPKRHRLSLRSRGK